jgi:hypothetical protein
VDWTLFQQGVIELHGVRAEDMASRFLGAEQPHPAISDSTCERTRPTSARNIEGPHGRELRELASQLPALAPEFDAVRDRSPELLERHDTSLLRRGAARGHG